MDIALWIMIIIMFSYSVTFAYSLWKDKNKMGAMVIFILGLFIAIGPYFILMK